MAGRHQQQVVLARHFNARFIVAHRGRSGSILGKGRLESLRTELLSLPTEKVETGPWGHNGLVSAIAKRYSQADYDRWRIQCAE